MKNDYDSLAQDYNNRGADLQAHGFIKEGQDLIDKATDLGNKANQVDIDNLLNQVAGLKQSIADANDAVNKINSIHETIAVITQLLGLAISVKSLNPITIDGAVSILNQSLQLISKVPSSGGDVT